MFLLKFIFLIGFCYSEAATSYCRLNFEQELPDNEPLFFDVNGELAVPIKEGSFEGFQFEDGEEIEVFCPGEGNGFEEERTSRKRIRCDDGTLIENSKPAKRYRCQEPSLESPPFISSVIRPLERSCGENNEGKIFQIGFGEDLSSFWYNLIEVCFNPTKSVTYYAYHTLYGKALLGQEKGLHKTSPKWLIGSRFFNGLFPNNFKPMNAYGEKNVKNVLLSLFDSSTVDEILLINKRIEKGHLAANADFYFKKTRRASFNLINAVPLWKNLNWSWYKQVEDKIRKYAKSNPPHDLNAYTGPFGILKIKESPIYLDPSPNKKLPVPKFIWKIIQDIEYQQGIAFIMYNNLYKTEDLTDKEWPCTKLLDCREYDWSVSSSLKDGITKCCEVTDILGNIPYIPEINVSQGILLGTGEEFDIRDDLDDCDVCSDCEDVCCDCDDGEGLCDIDADVCAH